MNSLPTGFLPMPIPIYQLSGPGNMPLLPTPILPPHLMAFQPHLHSLVTFSPIPPPMQHLGRPAVPELRTLEQEQERNDILELLQELSDPYVRDFYVVELIEKSGHSAEVAPLLWHSLGSMSCLIDDIVSGYVYIDPPKLTSAQARKLCNTLKLLQCVAQHPETRPLFLNAHIHMLLHPYLNTTAKEEHIESLKQSTLSVILELVKENDNNVVCFLLTTTAEILPLCFRIIKTDIYTDLATKLIATVILRNVLTTDYGLFHICHNRYFLTDIVSGLSKITKYLSSTKQISAHSRLLKYIIQCFLRLSDDIVTRDLLRKNIPHQLKDSACSNCFKDDLETRQWLNMLWKNLGLIKHGKINSKQSEAKKQKENGKKKENCKTPHSK